MRRLKPVISLRAIATPRRRRDTEPTSEAYLRLAAASAPWTFWFAMPPLPPAHDHDLEDR